MHVDKRLDNVLPGSLTKRVFDVMGAAIALAVLSPAMLVLALIIRLRLGPSVLFRQLRPGYRGRAGRSPSADRREADNCYGA